MKQLLPVRAVRQTKLKKVIGSEVFIWDLNAHAVRSCFLRTELFIEDAPVGDGVRFHR
jgi:hypothetical protein